MGKGIERNRATEVADLAEVSGTRAQGEADPSVHVDDLNVWGPLAREALRQEWFVRERAAEAVYNAYVLMIRAGRYSDLLLLQPKLAGHFGQARRERSYWWQKSKALVSIGGCLSMMQDRHGDVPLAPDLAEPLSIPPPGAPPSNSLTEDLEAFELPGDYLGLEGDYLGLEEETVYPLSGRWGHKISAISEYVRDLRLRVYGDFARAEERSRRLRLQLSMLEMATGGLELDVWPRLWDELEKGETAPFQTASLNPRPMLPDEVRYPDNQNVIHDPFADRIGLKYWYYVREEEMDKTQANLAVQEWHVFHHGEIIRKNRPNWGGTISDRMVWEYAKDVQERMEIE